MSVGGEPHLELLVRRFARVMPALLVVPLWIRPDVNCAEDIPSECRAPGFAHSVDWRCSNCTSSRVFRLKPFLARNPIFYLVAVGEFVLVCSLSFVFCVSVACDCPSFVLVLLCCIGSFCGRNG